ncbi:dihydroxyacetone kinase transcriptional activator DhaS [Clostridium paraputrificum]|uniref:dihydroxyacetone kinase transcriptional activator DhaS n=1 Tax=Clostridium paraputrificum TaxID=29363 RepID=UPI003D335B5F
MSQMTKESLAKSLKKMMEKKSLQKITITDLVNDCGVNRQTFYYHFQDIYDLLGWIYKTEAVGSISNCISYDTWQEGFLKIFQYVSNNKSFCMNTFHSMGREHLEDFLQNEIFNLLIDVVEEVSKGSPVSTKEKEFIANFYTFAFIGILTSWMKAGMKDSPESIIEKLERLINGDIIKVIKKTTLSN